MVDNPDTSIVFISFASNKESLFPKVYVHKKMNIKSTFLMVCTFCIIRAQLICFLNK